MVTSLGIQDKGDSNFAQFVVMNKPSRVKSIIIMQDLTGWYSPALCTLLNKDQALLVLKNVAALHAKFWGNKNKEISDKFAKCKTDIDYRQAYHSKAAAWMRKGNFASTEAIKKKIDKFYSGEWINHEFMTLSNDAGLPDWATIQPLENGSYCIMKDDLIRETLNVMAERLPKFNEKKLKHFVTEKEPQTLLHGDFHCGNHMYGRDENEGKIFGLDFQWAGKGLVSIELLYFFNSSWANQNYEEILELMKGKEIHSMMNY